MSDKLVINGEKYKGVLRIHGPTQIIINNVRTKVGHGFYTNFKTFGNMTIILEDEAYAKIGKTVFKNTILTIQSNNTAILVRTPTIEIIGKTVIEELHARLPGEIPYQGEKLVIEGLATIKIFLSDTYTLFHSLKINGKTFRNPPLIPLTTPSNVLEITIYLLIAYFILEILKRFLKKP